MCGHRFDPEEHKACGGCPLNDSCLLACCPSCGYSMVNPDRSRLVSLWTRLANLPTRLTAAWRLRRPGAATPIGSTRLSDARPGSVMQVVEIDASVSVWHEQLQAYGLAPGREVKVIQQSPVTVVRVEHVDLAFESNIARGIVVEPA